MVKIADGTVWNLVSTMSAGLISFALFAPTCVLAQSQSSAANSELFLARYHSTELFPECSEGGVRACSGDLVVQVRRDLPAAQRPPAGSPLNLLPNPLLSAALFSGSANSSACHLSDLASELNRQERQSLMAGAAGMAMAASEATSACYGVVSPQTKPWDTLMWSGGKIYGWLSCITGESNVLGCEVFLYPREASPSDDNQVYAEIDGIVKSAAIPALKHLKRIAQRLDSLVETKTTTVTDINVEDVSEFDMQTKAIFE